MLGTGADRLCTPSTATGPFRLFAVPGFQNRSNDVVYCPPIIRDSPDQEPSAVVYFGGDVQDFPESMETNRDSRGYMKYNLENSAILLREAFPRSHIVVIRPVRMEFKTFSCFDNFVRGNNAGVPDHTPMNHALQHLEKLLQNLSHRLVTLPENEIQEQAAQSAATAAAVAAATAAALTLSAANSDTNNISQVTKITSMHAGASTSSSVPTTITHVTYRRRYSKSGNNDNNQEMDVDILQVNENSPNLQLLNANDCTNGKEEETELEATKNSNNLNNGTKNDSNNIDHQHEHEPEPENDSTRSNANANDNDNCEVDMQSDTSPSSQPEQNPLWWREHLNLDKAKLHLIGFSKGCVVLNQFIYEFHYLKTLTPDDSTMCRLLSRIKEMYWLDGGHGGQKNTWITSRSLLETLTRMGINVHVHLTPYQVQDDRRPWIRKEEKLFSDLLKKLGCPVIRQLHYDSQTPNLMTHFEVLNAFCQFQNQLLQHHQQSMQNDFVKMHAQRQLHQQQQLQQQLQHHQSQQSLYQNENGNEKTSDDNGSSEEK